MAKKEGFLLLEVAIALLLISSFFAVLAGYLSQTVQLQAEARKLIQAINYAGNYLEMIPQHQPAMSLSEIYKVTVEKQPLINEGSWEPLLGPSELKELHTHFYLVSITVEWEGLFGKKRSYKLICGNQEQGDAQ
jgi:hypothetical protein